MAVYSGQATVVTAGTPVRLNAGRPVFGQVAVMADPANTGNIYIGNVNDTVSSTTGFVLQKGQWVTLNCVRDLANVWVDASAANQKVSWLILNIA